MYAAVLAHTDKPKIRELNWIWCKNDCEWFWSDFKWKQIQAPFESKLMALFIVFATYRVTFSYGRRSTPPYLHAQHDFRRPSSIPHALPPWLQCHLSYPVLSCPVSGGNILVSVPPFTLSLSIWEAGQALHGTLGPLPNHVRLPARAHHLSLMLLRGVANYWKGHFA